VPAGRRGVNIASENYTTPLIPLLKEEGRKKKNKL